MRTTRSLISKLRLFGLGLCGLVMSAYSQEAAVVMYYNNPSLLIKL